MAGLYAVMLDGPSFGIVTKQLDFDSFRYCVTMENNLRPVPVSAHDHQNMQSGDELLGGPRVDVFKGDVTHQLLRNLTLLNTVHESRATIHTPARIPRIPISITAGSREEVGNGTSSLGYLTTSSSP